MNLNMRPKQPENISSFSVPVTVLEEMVTTIELSLTGKYAKAFNVSFSLYWLNIIKVGFSQNFHYELFYYKINLF